MLKSVPPNVDQWISSNSQLLDLLKKSNLDHSGHAVKEDAFATFLSYITNAPNLQPLGRYHSLRFWNEFLLEKERQDILVYLRHPDTLVQQKGIAGISALFKHYIPIVDPPLPFAVPVWKLYVEWPDEQWQDMVHKMNEDSLYDVFPTLACKIRIPINVNDPDWEFISTVCSHSEDQDVSVDVAKDVCSQLYSIKNNFWSTQIFDSDDKSKTGTSFRSFFSSPVFGNGRDGSWHYIDYLTAPLSVYFYPVKHANAQLRKMLIPLGWHVVDTNGFPVIICSAVSSLEDYDKSQVCYLSIALLYIARTAMAEIAGPMQSRRVSLMALRLFRSGVQRYIFSFDSFQPQRIQYWSKYFSFGKLADLGKLWLELQNSRTLFPKQFHGLPLVNWFRDLEKKWESLLQFPGLTPRSSSDIFSQHRSRSQCVDPLDQERRKNRVTWLNTYLREFKYRVDKFIHEDVVRLIHWTSLQTVEYAKFFSPNDFHELSIHHYLLSLPSHPYNRTVPIIRVLTDPDGYSVVFTPNVGERLSRPSTVVKFLEMALQICHAVNFMHHHGIAHLDLKIENIILSPDNRITIIDFSSSFPIPPPPGHIDKYLGTPGYMAPEIEKGIPYDPILADIYSLGRVFRLTCFLSFEPFYDMAVSMTNDEPSFRPPILQIIAWIQSFIADEHSQMESARSGHYPYSQKAINDCPINV